MRFERWWKTKELIDERLMQGEKHLVVGLFISHREFDACIASHLYIYPHVSILYVLISDLIQVSLNLQYQSGES